MLLKDSDDTIVMPSNCSDKVSSQLNDELSPINCNHENDLLHHNLCSMSKCLSSSKPFSNMNASPENVAVPYDIADRQRVLRNSSHDTCYEDDLYIQAPKSAPHE